MSEGVSEGASEGVSEGGGTRPKSNSPNTEGGEKRKFRRKFKAKTKRNRGNLREGREAPPRRSLHPLRFCFRFNLHRNLRIFNFWGSQSIYLGVKYPRREE